MIRAILTDIEGTTSSLSFVKDVLFPYARQHIGEFVRKHADGGSIDSQLNAVRAEAGEDLDIEAVIATLEQWIDEDRKITPLKSLQGLLWETGYQQGDFTGHIYPDAYTALEHWKQQGIDLYVYSSGSVYAQKLLFGHTAFGDLNQLFSGYFDTNIGPKIEPGSYRRIAAETGIAADEILFLSDIEAELDAAREAGMQTAWLVRGGTPAANAKHRQVPDFAAIRL